MDTPPTQRGDTGAGQSQDPSEPGRRHDDAPNDADNEATPLLDNGHGASGDVPTGSTEHEWEGMADFKGLRWWKTPSVRCSLYNPLLIIFPVHSLC